jgi:REP element-mobilizing transposase RayT
MKLFEAGSAWIGLFRHCMDYEIPKEALAIHWIATTFGTWLHGDPRGSWINGRLCGPDPFLHEAVERRMRADSVVLSNEEMSVVADVIGQAIEENGWIAYAATIHPTHVHMAFAPPKRQLKSVIATFKYRTSRAVWAGRRSAGRTVDRSLWTEGQFPVFIFDDYHLENAVEYVREHNRRVGRDSDPYPWLRCNVLKRLRHGQG